MSALPPWPENLPHKMYSDINYALREKHALAKYEAAVSRLRVAVAELKLHTGHYDCEDCWYSCSTICCNEQRKSDECDCGAHRVSDVLAAIGSVPNT